MTSMTEEIALVSRRTRRHAAPVGRVSNTKNRPQHEGRLWQQRLRLPDHTLGDNMEQHEPIMYSLYDNHCARPGCRCEHTTCDRGWINHTKGAWPCMYCREDLTGRLMKAAQAREKGYPQAAISRIIMGKQRTQ